MNGGTVITPSSGPSCHASGEGGNQSVGQVKARHEGPGITPLTAESRDLADAITAFLMEHPGSSVEDVARGVRVRTAAVREALLDGERFESSLRGAWLTDRARVYSVRRMGGDARGQARSDLAGALVVLTRGREPSQCDRILALLVDGRPWSSYELHKRVFCVLHSRIAELRRRLRKVGFDIEHTGGGSGTDVHWYRLVCTTVGASEGTTAAKDAKHADLGVDGATVVPSDASASSTPESIACPAGAEASEPVQLQLGAAA